MKQTIVTSLVLSLILFLLNWYLSFAGSLVSICLAAVAGFVITISQSRTHAYEFVPALVIGSLLLALVSTSLLEIAFYMTVRIPFHWSRLVHEDGAVLQGSFNLAFSMLGGFAGIVYRGITSLFAKTK